MMKKCKQCKVYIADNELVCPLCQTVLETVSEPVREAMYPVIEFNPHKYNLITRLILFCSVVLGLVLIGVNAATYDGVWWSLISTGLMVYLWITMLFSIERYANPALKILVQTLAAQALCLWADWVLGYRGWAVNYAVPAIVLVANGATLVLQLINFMNWQSYILFQLEYLGFSIILGILYGVGIITRPFLAFTAIFVSILIFAGTMIFGDKKAKSEVKRRFYI